MKKMFVSAALAALALAGCAKNEVIGTNGGAPGHIALGATATRAAIAVTSTLQDAAGFVVYGVTADAPAVWYTDGDGNAIDGTNNHRYAAGKWNFADPVKWPTAAAAYPMNFYAYYASSYAGFAMTSQTTDELEGVYTVQAVGSQADFLAAKAATGANKPAADMLNITFSHILSKVNYGLEVRSGFDAWVQSLTVKNVANSRTYDFRAGDWTAASAPAASACTNSYLYFTGPSQKFGGNDTKTPFYAAPHTSHLMLMPQTVAAQRWTPVSGTAPATESYVYMLYRLEKTEAPAETNYIGYASATDHPGYAGSQAEADGYTGALFVAVGYPYDLAWAGSKGYNYNIPMPGANGGYLVDDVYYDEDGDPTDLPIENLDTGDPVLGDGYIHLIPDVGGWDDQAGIDID